MAGGDHNTFDLSHSHKSVGHDSPAYDLIVLNWCHLVSWLNAVITPVR